MNTSLRAKISSMLFFEADKNERLKFIFLTLMYFFVIASYTLIKEFKNSIFMSIVGIEYLPTAKIIAMVVLVPAILFYSYLVDRLRRYQLLAFYSIFYSIAILMFACFLSHPTIGIENTQASPDRIFGWFFYFCVEGFSPFVVSVFWAFANSITSPDSAKKNYSIMVSGSKLGGVFSAALAYVLLQSDMIFGFAMSGLMKHQALFILSAIFLFVVPVITILLMKRVPGRDLHGYEAAYQFEKSKEKELAQSKPSMFQKFVIFFKSLFGGLVMFVRQPYVLGMFSIIFFYEVLNVVIDFLRLKIIREAAPDLCGLNCILFQHIFYINLVVFIISLFGTTPLLRKFGERNCLILIPILNAVFIMLLLANVNLISSGTVNLVAFVYIGIRAVNYAISYPVRESLYIPTVKEIKFKSKSWIDAFGTKFAKSTGSTFNLFARAIPHAYMICFGGILFFWLIAAYLLGNRYDKAIKNNEVIGE